MAFESRSCNQDTLSWKWENSSWEGVGTHKHNSLGVRQTFFWPTELILGAWFYCCKDYSVPVWVMLCLQHNFRISMRIFIAQTFNYNWEKSIYIYKKVFLKHKSGTIWDFCLAITVWGNTIISLFSWFTAPSKDKESQQIFFFFKWNVLFIFHCRVFCAGLNVTHFHKMNIIFERHIFLKGGFNNGIAKINFYKTFVFALTGCSNNFGSSHWGTQSKSWADPRLKGK